nr:E3 ubiquitin-protein ligase XIAP-like isoform X2 [Biomphalaria glabrata]
MGHNYVETVLELATQQSQITEQMIRDWMNLPIAVGDRMNLPGDARDRMNLPRDVRDRMNLLNYAVRDRMNLPRDVRDRINLPRAIGGRYLQPGLTRAQVPHSGNISDLQAEYNWRLSRLICEICQRKDVQVIFIPCGHVITCVECSLLQEFCNSCHSHIEGKTRIFFE